MPFVFDLRRCGSPVLARTGLYVFEVVPGIPAGHRGTKLRGGFPVRPGGGRTLTLVAGHEDECRRTLTSSTGNISPPRRQARLYLGHRQAQPCPTLLTHGGKAKMTAAVIYDGNLPPRRRISGARDILGKRAEFERPTAGSARSRRVTSAARSPSLVDPAAVGKRVLVTTAFASRRASSSRESR